ATALLAARLRARRLHQGCDVLETSHVLRVGQQGVLRRLGKRWVGGEDVRREHLTLVERRVRQTDPERHEGRLRDPVPLRVAEEACRACLAGWRASELEGPGL